jgi:peptidoglycan/xylan/chitin deacetylase (PgdA/CDA1 family)
MYIVLLIVLFLLFHVYFLPDYLLKPLLNKKIVYKTDANVLFTFDDSPTEYTDALLDLLLEFDIKAIFFVLSDNIEGNERIMDRIVNEGHAVGNHGLKDRTHWSMSERAFEADLLESETKLRPWMQKKWFRPGHGYFNDAMLRTLDRHGYTMMLGNIYPFDKCITSPAINAWFIRTKMSPGSIVVLHDTRITVPTLKKLFANST